MLPKKVFYNADPLGKTISLNNQFGTHLYTVKGSLKHRGPIRHPSRNRVFTGDLKNKANLSDNGWAYLDNLDSQYILMFLELQKAQTIYHEKN